ncbi:nuclear transport factor 2 family protein [Mucilaginibacter sp. HD30]|jgi:nuclear transport factor 2 (NTF2) superfamily protein
MNNDQMSKTQHLIAAAYNGFNSRNIDSVLPLMHQNIRWPKAFEGGYVIGKEAIREYWTRQWSEINPLVKPQAITVRENGKVEVLVHQLVKDLEGNVLFDGDVKHVYEVKDDLLFQMDIETD